MFSYPFQQFVQDIDSNQKLKHHMPEKAAYRRQKERFKVQELNSFDKSVSLPRLITTRDDTQERVISLKIQHFQTDSPLINVNSKFKQSKQHNRFDRKPFNKHITLEKIKTKTQESEPDQQTRKSQAYELALVHSHQFAQNLFKDEVLGPFMRSISDPDFFQTLYMGFYEFGRTFNLSFNEEKFKRFLSDLRISNGHFDRMKMILLTELMNLPLEYVLPCVWRMETFRYAFTRSKTPLEHMGDQIGLLKASERAYGLVTNDFILQNYFKGNDLGLQIQKFSRLMAQLIRFQETPTNVMDMLRNKHKNFDLTHVHFAMFKQKVTHAFREGGVPVKLLWHLLFQVDLYKNDILNYDPIASLIREKYETVSAFSEELYDNCLDHNYDPIINSEKFRKMLDYIVTYMISPYRLGIDFRLLYSYFKIKLRPAQIQMLNQKFQKLIQRLDAHPVVTGDFLEEWDEIIQVMSGEQRPYKILGGWDKVITLSEAVYDESKDDTYLISTYKDNNVDPKTVMQNEVFFLCSGKKFFKRSDIKCIHQRFFITDQVFDMYAKNLNSALRRCKIQSHGKNLVALFESYRELIVQEDI